MTESSVLELLLKSKSTNPTSEQPHFPKLSPDCVESLSKNFTDVLYDSLRSKSALQEPKHANVLLLLRKWCTSPGRNFQIDNDNYDCLVEALLGISNVDSTDPGEDFQLELRSEQLAKLSVAETVIQHYKKLEDINSDKDKLLENIMMRDRKKCGSIDFSLNIPKNTEVSSSICMLELINQQKSCPVSVVDENPEVTPCVKSRDVSREKQIRCAHALLNLNKTSKDISLLSAILKNLKRYERLEPVEVEFISYLWKNWAQFELPMEISTLLLESFSFIYEKDFIGMCTDALRKNPKDDTPAVTESVRRILELSSKNEILRFKIRSLLYELYACSGYDDRLSNVLALM